LVAFKAGEGQVDFEPLAVVRKNSICRYCSILFQVVFMMQAAENGRRFDAAACGELVLLLNLFVSPLVVAQSFGCVSPTSMWPRAPHLRALCIGGTTNPCQTSVYVTGRSTIALLILTDVDTPPDCDYRMQMSIVPSSMITMPFANGTIPIYGGQLGEVWSLLAKDVQAVTHVQVKLRDIYGVVRRVAIIVVPFGAHPLPPDSRCPTGGGCR
jgi:hypothetical protein